MKLRYKTGGEGYWSLEWGTEPITKPGYYWLRMVNRNYADKVAEFIACVVETNGVMTAVGGHFGTFEGALPVNTENFECWDGPLEKPLTVLEVCRVSEVYHAT